jgi:pseudouridine synthase
MRLEKFLAESGIMSRRTAKKCISDGRVTVNGECAQIPGTHIAPDTDEVKVDGKPIQEKPKLIYLMLNKPPGYLSTRHDERSRPTVMDLVCDIPERIYPVGRLDMDTEGLLLMTNDGAFAHKLTHPSHEIEKTYIAWVEGEPGREAVDRLRAGVMIQDGKTAPAKVVQIGSEKGCTQFRVVIHEGKKRQIRRMFGVIQHKVISLKRVQIGSLSLGTLPRGKYRLLTQTQAQEIQAKKHPYNEDGS